MIVFMSLRDTKKGNLKIGEVIAEFLDGLSKRVKWPLFKQFYILLMVFLQFVIEKHSHLKVLE